MDKTKLNDLKESLSSDLTKYKGLTLDDPEKAKLLAIIQKEVAIYITVEQKEFDRKDRMSQTSLELKKVNHQIYVDNKKAREDFKKELRAIELEKKNYDLEREKFEYEKSKDKTAKFDKIVDISIRVIEVIAPLAVYAGLVMMNFRLVYADDGRSPSDMKDLLKNVIK